MNNDFQRKGHGRQLIAYAIRSLNRSAKTVYVQADRTAKEFYEKCEFTDKDVGIDSDKYCVAMKAQRSKVAKLQGCRMRAYA